MSEVTKRKMIPSSIRVTGVQSGNGRLRLADVPIGAVIFGNIATSPKLWLRAGDYEFYALDTREAFSLNNVCNADFQPGWRQVDIEIIVKEHAE